MLPQQVWTARFAAKSNDWVDAGLNTLPRVVCGGPRMRSSKARGSLASAKKPRQQPRSVKAFSKINGVRIKIALPKGIEGIDARQIFVGDMKPEHT